MLFIITIAPFLGFAQSKLLTPKKKIASVKNDIEKVSRDFYLDFNNLKGDTIFQASNTTMFASKVIPDGALQSVITKYESPKSYSWQATMFKNESFEEAVLKYKEYFEQLNGANFTFVDKTTHKLSGVYDTPDEGRGFASSKLAYEGDNHDLQLFKIEISLSYLFPVWIVEILMYEKISDKNMRPTAKSF